MLRLLWACLRGRKCPVDCPSQAKLDPLFEADQTKPKGRMGRTGRVKIIWLWARRELEAEKLGLVSSQLLAQAAQSMFQSVHTHALFTNNPSHHRFGFRQPDPWPRMAEPWKQQWFSCAGDKSPAESSCGCWWRLTAARGRRQRDRT